jgi:alanine dehydrogenase
MEVNMGELLALLAIPAAGGAAWAGVKSGLNGARASIAQIERIVNRLDNKVDSHGERLAAVETEAENLKERVADAEKRGN